jgi:hypothetical protein
MKRTLYAGLGYVTWKIGKRYVRQRARSILGLARPSTWARA